MRRLITLGLILGVGVLGCSQQPPKAEEGVPIRDTIPAAQLEPAPEPIAVPEPVISHAPPGEEDLPTDDATAPDEDVAPANAAEPTPAPEPAPEKKEAPQEIVNYPGTVYGSEIHDPAMTVAEFLKNAESLEGQVVTIEGTLGQVCQDMGCWFYLRPDGATKDNKDKIYVDLQMGAVFTIPKDTEGKHAVVTGKVAKNANGYKLVGKGTVLS